MKPANTVSLRVRKFGVVLSFTARGTVAALGNHVEGIVAARTGEQMIFSNA
jgi:hypothetical protein